MSDAALRVQPIASSNEWRAWLQTHAAKLFLYARLQTRNVADAEDVLQDALIDSWQKAGHQAPSLPLVFATIRRRAIEHARSNDRRARREQANQPDAWFAPEIEPRDNQRLLEEAVKSLTPIYREVITLKVWGGLTFREIAETIDVPLNTAASRYRYALDELRGMLKEAQR